MRRWLDYLLWRLISHRGQLAIACRFLEGFRSNTTQTVGLNETWGWAGPPDDGITLTRASRSP